MEIMANNYNKSVWLNIPSHIINSPSIGPLFQMPAFSKREHFFPANLLKKAQCLEIPTSLRARLAAV